MLDMTTSKEKKGTQQGEEAARARFLDCFQNLSEAMMFEASVLSMGEEFLPACAQGAGLNGTLKTTAEYWKFLLSQVEDVGDE